MNTGILAWRSAKWFMLFSPDDGGSAGGGESAPEQGGTDGGKAGDGNDPEAGKTDPQEDGSAAEIAKMKAELEKMKKAVNDATGEAAKYKKELRAKQTAEEIAAEEKKAADEAAKAEIENLRKEVARTRTVKTVMAKLGTDEETSGRIADCLYGAEDPDNAMLEIQKAWAAREKALRLEYGKIPGPGSGDGSGEDAQERAAIELAKKLGKARAENNKPVRDGLQGYLR